MFLFVIDYTDRSSEPPKSRSNSRRPSLSDEKEVLVLQVINLVLFVMYRNRANKSSWILIDLQSVELFGFYSVYIKYFGQDRVNQNFWKFRSKTQWISLVQPEKFKKKTGPPFEVDHFSRLDQSEFWLNGSHPLSHLRPLSTLLQQNLLLEHCKQNIVVLIRLFSICRLRIFKLKYYLWRKKSLICLKQ